MSNLLDQFIIQALERMGLDGLTSEQKELYIPQLTDRLQERIGLELFPTLSEKDKETFLQLAEKGGLVSQIEWTNFWRGAVVDFDQELERILVKFLEDLQQSLH